MTRAALTGCFAEMVSGAEDGVDLEQELELARGLLRAEADAVGGLPARLGDDFLTAVGLIVSCVQAHGNVVVAGLGKSGLIGAKISATLASLGIPSQCLHPVEAVHGDLGRLRKQDVAICLSYSGQTEEVVALAATLRQDGLPIIAITRGGNDPDGRATCALARLATATLTIGAVDEQNGLTPAPMCSSTAMLAMGDALALVASRRMKFTDEDFARRHPGGALGGLLRPVLEVLRFRAGVNLEPIGEKLTVSEALEQAARVERRPGALLLVGDDGRLTGIFTDADLRRLILKDPGMLSRPIADVMTRSPGALVDTALVRDAVRMVREFRRDEIPVVDADGRPVGLLDVQDLVALKVVEPE